MITSSAIAVLMVLQQGANTSPASGDTIGYWQQRASYRIVGRLDESSATLHGVADLTYVNNSPDTLREMYVHQYLNAFRPGSKWSAVDEREGRVRFQHLRDPDFGYERFTSVPTFDGTAETPEYPGAPDSTVVHFKLPHPLAPHDSMRVHFEWNARPSTTLRRQGRKGRSYDFAQWYPKVAVYDRGGWEPNPLVPAGELYGEFGTYDVTLVVPFDDVIGATGVPISGDPGWEAAKRGGVLYIPVNAYADVPSAPPVGEVAAGDKAVRFYARDVHHFAWSTSPDYRYEGGVYVRRAADMPFPTWDTLAINVLYRPGDDTTWGGGRAVRRTIQAFEWLEKIWGPFAWPTFTNLHRLEGGGTEFPMLIMDGAADLGLILHEAGHNFTYGILANNEWRSAWMDEGLTSYQTAWAQNQTPQEAVRFGPPPPDRLAEGYRVNATTMSRQQQEEIRGLRLDLSGRSEPIGTSAKDFREFGIYNEMVYSRGELMYSQLRDVMGDSAFTRFFHDYYTRWALKHVDERAMRASAERASGKDLGWFFDQWVHRTGLVDYALTSATTSRQSDGRWVTRLTVVRRGEYVHPMPVGVRTPGGWTMGRADEKQDVSTVVVTTDEQPVEVRLDPWNVTADWDRRNDVTGPSWFGLGGAQTVFDWPLLDQSNRDRSLVAFSPVAWFSDPGALTVGVRAGTNYLGLVDKYDLGLAVTTASRPTAFSNAPLALSRVQGWWRFENPYWPLAPRPLMGVKGGVAFLDGVAKADLSRTWDLSPFVLARGPRISATLGITGAYLYDSAMLPDGWDDRSLTEVHGAVSVRMPNALLSDSGYVEYRGAASIGGARATQRFGVFAQNGAPSPLLPPPTPPASFIRGEAEARSVNFFMGGSEAIVVRGYAALSNDPPAQAAVHLSSLDPLSTFDDNWYRPRGAVLKRAGLNFLPLGGAELRGYDASVTVRKVVAANADVAQRIAPDVFDKFSLWASAFGDAGFASSETFALSGSMLLDAGVGLSMRGQLYDRHVTVRIEAPLLALQPGLAGGRGLTRSRADIAARWIFSFNDLW